jgi:hypothetical protein
MRLSVLDAYIFACVWLKRWALFRAAVAGEADIGLGQEADIGLGQEADIGLDKFNSSIIFFSHCSIPH